MKIDMHCHVKEGSIDSRVSMEEYIQLLQSRGFGGMVITDHDTYNGYRYWKKNLKDKNIQTSRFSRALSTIPLAPATFL